MGSCIKVTFLTRTAQNKERFLYASDQLITITHNVLKAFDANLSLEVHGVSLDLSKAFDRF